jgi:hypothetical protein
MTHQGQFQELHLSPPPDELVLAIPQSRLLGGTAPERCLKGRYADEALAGNHQSPRAAPDRRVGAATAFLGDLWLSFFPRFSGRDVVKAPARGGGQALPGGALPRLGSGQRDWSWSLRQLSGRRERRLRIKKALIPDARWTAHGGPATRSPGWEDSPPIPPPRG